MSKYSIKKTKPNRGKSGFKTSKFTIETVVASKTNEIVMVRVTTTDGVVKEFNNKADLESTWNKVEAYLSTRLVEKQKLKTTTKSRKRGQK